jgi:hypothetical protein
VKLLLVLSRGRASEKFKCCMLNVYLDKLADIKVEESCIPDTAELSFSCFSKISRWGNTFDELLNHETPHNILEAFFNRRAALEFPRNQPGADLLSPVRINDNNQTLFRYLLVQINNVARHYTVNAFEKLTPGTVFGANSKWCQYDLGFALLINVGCPSTSSEVQIHNRKIGEIR